MTDSIITLTIVIYAKKYLSKCKIAKIQRLQDLDEKEVGTYYMSQLSS